MKTEVTWARSLSVITRNLDVTCPSLVKSASNDGLVLELIKEVRLTLSGRELMGTN